MAFDVTKKAEGTVGGSVAPPVTLAMQGAVCVYWVEFLAKFIMPLRRLIYGCWNDSIYCCSCAGYRATANSTARLEQYAPTLCADDHRMIPIGSVLQIASVYALCCARPQLFWTHQWILHSSYHNIATGRIYRTTHRWGHMAYNSSRAMLEHISAKKCNRRPAELMEQGQQTKHLFSKNISRIRVMPCIVCLIEPDFYLHPFCCSMCCCSCQVSIREVKLVSGP